jgi:hypothetical protein
VRWRLATFGRNYPAGFRSDETVRPAAPKRQDASWQETRDEWQSCHWLARWAANRLGGMELLVLLGLFVLLALASALGWTADSRDSADWTPSDDGHRRPRLRLRRL